MLKCGGRAEREMGMQPEGIDRTMKFAMMRKKEEIDDIPLRVHSWSSKAKKKVYNESGWLMKDRRGWKKRWDENDRIG